MHIFKSRHNSGVQRRGAPPGKSYTTQDELVARYRLEPAQSQLAATEVIQRMAMHRGRQDSQGRWEHKADRRVYTNFRQVAGVPLWEKIKVPALEIKREHSKRLDGCTIRALQKT